MPINQGTTGAITRDRARKAILDALSANAAVEQAVLDRADVDLQLDVDVDSLRMVDVLCDIEVDLGISIPGAECKAKELRSVNKLADHIVAVSISAQSPTS